MMFEAERLFQLSNAEVCVSFERKSITSICIGGEEFIEKAFPFFAVKMRGRDGSSRWENAFGFSYLGAEGETVKYRSSDLDVELSIVSENDSLRWRIRIHNRSEEMIEQVELLSVGLHGALKDEPSGKGEVLIPYNEGAVVSNLERRLKSPFSYLEPEYPSLGKYFVFPNMICAQFLAYQSSGKGIYFGMHDPERGTKHIDFKKEDGALKIQMRAFADCDYGQDYEMDFDSVLRVYRGGMYEAFSIYRDWFEGNLPENLRKISENPALPKWYGESPIVVIYPVRGSSDGDLSMAPNPVAYPYSNMIPKLTEIADATDSVPMALLMQWEGTAPWCPPYYWPPYGGEKAFNAFLFECHEKGFLVGLYGSGLGWTNESHRVPYSRADEFESDHLANLMCADTDGHMESTIVQDIRFGYDVCPALEQSKKLIADEASRIFSHGVDYLQLMDQNHGGCSYFCYSDKHGHIPAPGKWQAKETNRLLERIDRKGGLLGSESAASEPMIGNLPFSDNRFILNYYIGKPVPMYGFLYHEYVNNFTGNQICMALDDDPDSYAYRLSYGFIAGDMFAIVLDGNGRLSDAWCSSRLADEKGAFSFLRTLNHWRKAHKEFLQLGRMEAIEEYETEERVFIHEDRTPIREKAVLSAAFSHNRRTRQYLVNYTSKPQTVAFRKKHRFYLDEPGGEIRDSFSLRIAPRSVAYFEKED